MALGPKIIQTNRDVGRDISWQFHVLGTNLKKSWDQESTEPEVVSPILTVGVNNMEDSGHGLLTGVSKENTLSSATLDFLT